MENIFNESGLSFRFPNDAIWEKFDHSNEAGYRKAFGMKSVDLLIEEPEKFLLIEIKNPNTPAAKSHNAKEEFKRKLYNDELYPELVEKIRDSYTFLHLMERDTKPIIYIVLINVENSEEQQINFLTLKDKLIGKIRCETNTAWQRDYIKDCAVLDLKEWHEKFPDYQINEEV